VYEYHIQNSYDIDDWKFLLLKYDSTNNMLLQKKFLEALTYTRLPSLLSRFIESQQQGALKKIDFFDAVRLFGQNAIGREIAWNYIRLFYDELYVEYGEDDYRLGQMVIDVSASFDTEFLFFELLNFVYFTPPGSSINARLKALEIASTNYLWLEDKENEIIAAFQDDRNIQHKQDLLSELNRYKNSSSKEEFLKKVNLKISEHPLFFSKIPRKY
jgi:hypothetical protein